MHLIPVQAELEQLRKKLSETETKHARTVHDVIPLIIVFFSIVTDVSAAQKGAL
jgi:hypothetical protein